MTRTEAIATLLRRNKGRVISKPKDAKLISCLSEEDVNETLLSRIKRIDVTKDDVELLKSFNLGLEYYVKDQPLRYSEDPSLFSLKPNVISLPVSLFFLFKSF